MLRKPIVIFLLLSTVLAILFFTFPIAIFDGVIVHKTELGNIKADTQLSLSFFLGFGIEEGDLADIETFYLTLKGKVMAVLFICGFPGLLALKMYSKQK